jgi:phage baseplate assembly protein W
MTKFNFKSSGSRINDRNVSIESFTKKKRDIGIKTPLSNAQGHQIFDMNQDPVEQIKDNLRNLIITNFGERLGLYDFGADLNSLVFEFINNPSIESEIVERIETAVEKYMPGISITEISQIELDRAEKEDANRRGLAKIKLRILYDIPSGRIGNQSLDVILHGGG